MNKKMLGTIILLSITVFWQSEPLASAPVEKKSSPITTKFPGQLRDKGLMAEFRRLEEEIKSRIRGPGRLKKTLESNLILGLRRLIYRRFYADREALTKNLRVDTMVYDNPNSPLSFYVKFISGKMTFMARMDFSRDPEYYLQFPVDAKLLVRNESDGKKHDKSTGKSQP